MPSRQAVPEDAPELVRLRAVMLRGMSGHGPWTDDWREPARQTLVKRLSEPQPTMAAFVVDRPDGSGLAACAVGTIEERLGGLSDPAGLIGYVFSVATEEQHRRRGYSRDCMTGLLDWFRSRDIHRIDLRASADGLSLYESLGFTRTTDPAMRLRLT